MVVHTASHPRHDLCACRRLSTLRVRVEVRGGLSWLVLANAKHYSNNNNNTNNKVYLAPTATTIKVIVGVATAVPGSASSLLWPTGSLARAPLCVRAQAPSLPTRLRAPISSRVAVAVTVVVTVYLRILHQQPLVVVGTRVVVVDGAARGMAQARRVGGGLWAQQQQAVWVAAAAAVREARSVIHMDSHVVVMTTLTRS